MSEDQILEGYLNIAYFGDGAYGIYAAAENYFGETPSQLTLAQAALLAGLVQSPDTDNPVGGHQAAALARRGYVLDAMAKMNAITDAQARAAEATPLALHPTSAPAGCTQVPAGHNDWGFFCDYFQQWWDAQPAFGATVADRERALKEGGNRVVTSLDPDVQAAALQQSLSVYGYNNPRALPIAVVQPGTGQVLSLAVSRHYSLDADPPGRGYPNTVDQLVAGGPGADGYPAGSIQAVHHAGRPGGGTSAVHQLRRDLPAGDPVPGQRPGQLRRVLVPGQRQPVLDGRAAPPCGTGTAAR